jgi:hypothetical protein
LLPKFQLGRIDMLKTIGTALLLSAAMAAGSAQALQVMVTQVDKNADGTATYHFSVKVDRNETLVPKKDFVTVYNFAGLVGTPKSPAGWAFSSEDFGRTPTWDGYPAVMPVDVPGLSNLTWTVTRPVSAGAEIAGFTATTSIAATTDGEYTAQSTRQQPAIGSDAAKAVKQAIIGQIPTPAFLH